MHQNLIRSNQPHDLISFTFRCRYKKKPILATCSFLLPAWRKSTGKGHIIHEDDLELCISRYTYQGCTQDSKGFFSIKLGCVCEYLASAKSPYPRFKRAHGKQNTPSYSILYDSHWCCLSQAWQKLCLQPPAKVVEKSKFSGGVECLVSRAYISGGDNEFSFTATSSSDWQHATISPMS